MNADELEKALLENADLKFRDFNSMVIPDTKRMIGVRMPVVRDLAKSICKDDWHSFLEEPSRSYEHTMVRALVIARARMEDDERLDLFLKFVPEVDNWAFCDILCGDLKIRSEEGLDRLWHICLDLLKTGEEFPMRVAAVTMLKKFIDDDHIDDVIDLMCTLPSPGYYYDMGAAWALSWCYMSYPEKTEEALFTKCQSRDILRMAVGKIRDSRVIADGDKERVKRKLREKA